MLDNFNFVKTFFGSDDEDEEKFQIKKKKERKVSYHPESNRNSNNKKKNKKKRKDFSLEEKDKMKRFNSVNNLIPSDRRISIDVSKVTTEKKKYDIEYDNGCVEYKLKLCDVDLERIKH